METDVIRVGLDKLGKELIKEFANELVTQGHKLTGSLINSLRQDILFAPSSFTLAFYGNHYGLYLETGRRKGAKKIPIDVLMKFVALRGMASTQKEARNIAFAIQMAIYKQGSPTKGAYKYTRNGKRINWISGTVADNKSKIQKTIQKLFKNQMETTLRNIAKDFNQKV
tara:strand:+ start:3233 stop:3739 length:507 start_codon:yes stop_codon:yes gene_type:complete